MANPLRQLDVLGQFLSPVNLHFLRLSSTIGRVATASPKLEATGYRLVWQKARDVTLTAFRIVPLSLPSPAQQSPSNLQSNLLRWCASILEQYLITLLEVTCLFDLAIPRRHDGQPKKSPQGPKPPLTPSKTVQKVPPDLPRPTPDWTVVWCTVCGSPYRRPRLKIVPPTRS